MRFLGTKCLMAQALSQALQNFIQQYRRIILQFGKIIEKKIDWSIRKQFQSVRQNTLRSVVCLQMQCKMDESLMLSWTWFCVRSNNIIHSKTSLGKKKTKLMLTPLRSRLKKDLKKKIRITHKSLETHYDYSSPVKNSSCLEINVVFKMCKNCFL